MKPFDAATLEKMRLGVSWDQRPDPEDAAFVIITMRLPNDGMPAERYTGAEAGDRLIRWAQGILAGAAQAAKQARRGGV